MELWRKERISEDMEIVSGDLSPAQMLDEVVEVARILQVRGMEDLTVEFGWGAKLEPELLWKQTQIKARDLLTYVQESEQRGIFSPGSSDLVIQSADRTLKVRLCHESDVHLWTDDQRLINEVVQHWREKGYSASKCDSNGGWRPIL